jgi:ribosomal protein S18 acetylase RimI-like enzyme
MTASETQIEVWMPKPHVAADEIAMLGEVLRACVHAGASVSFILPFSQEDANAFWRNKVYPAVESGQCRVVVARSAGNIVGTVQLDLATPPNQPHRAEVRKLLVHPKARRQGIARALMLVVEEQARQAQRDLLTLDTTTGGFAESLYRSLGYQTVGVIPRYSLRIDSPELDPTTVMYKILSSSAL